MEKLLAIELFLNPRLKFVHPLPFLSPIMIEVSDSRLKNNSADDPASNGDTSGKVRMPYVSLIFLLYVLILLSLSSFRPGWLYTPSVPPPYSV